MTEPAITPVVPPAAMNPKERLASLESNKSVSTLQNTLVTYKLKTPAQTKNARATQIRTSTISTWSSHQKTNRLAMKNR